MVLLIDECARLLNCKVKTLRDEINHPSNKLILQKALVGRKARTTYEDRNGLNKTILIGGITSKDGNSLPAYGRLAKQFNISVVQHFYARHRIKIRHPYLPCAIEKFASGEDRYYPFEMLELVEEKEIKPLFVQTPNANKKWLDNMFKTIGETSSPDIIMNNEENNEDDKNDEDSWRSCCSQSMW